MLTWLDDSADSLPSFGVCWKAHLSTDDAVGGDDDEDSSDDTLDLEDCEDLDDDDDDEKECGDNDDVKDDDSEVFSHLVSGVVHLSNGWAPLAQHVYSPLFPNNFFLLKNLKMFEDAPVEDLKKSWHFWIQINRW